MHCKDCLLDVLQNKGIDVQNAKITAISAYVDATDNTLDPEKSNYAGIFVSEYAVNAFGTQAKLLSFLEQNERKYFYGSLVFHDTAGEDYIVLPGLNLLGSGPCFHYVPSTNPNIPPIIYENYFFKYVTTGAGGPLKFSFNGYLIEV